MVPVVSREHLPTLEKIQVPVLSCYDDSTVHFTRDFSNTLVGLAVDLVSKDYKNSVSLYGLAIMLSN